MRWVIVVGAYLDRHINLGKAAEAMGMHRLALQEEFLQKGIPLRLGPESFEEASIRWQLFKSYSFKLPCVAKCAVVISGGRCFTLSNWRQI